MKNTIRLASAFCVIAMTAAMGGCGKKLPKLTEDQKTELKSTMDDSARTSTSIPGARDTAMTLRQIGPSDLGSRFPMLGFVGIASTSSARDAKEIAMRERLERDQKQAKCSINTADSGSIQNRDPASSLANFKMRIKVIGDSCPIAMDLDIRGKQTSQTQFSLGLGCTYSVKDEDYRKLNDIDTMDIHGGITIEAKSKDDANAKLNVTGKIHSQKYGADIPLALTGDIKMSGDKSDGATQLRLEFPTFTAEFKVEADGDKAKFFLNEEEVSKEEFTKYFEKLFSNGNSNSSGSGTLE